MLKKLATRTSIVKGVEISISASEWTQLNQQLTQSQIIDLISDTIESNKLPLPLRKISQNEAFRDFRHLQSYDCRKLWKKGDLFTKYKYSYPIKDEYIEISTAGNKASDYFHQENRYRCNSINSPSPYRIWTTETFRKNWLKSLWSMKYKEINSRILREALALRGYTASQFRPSVAKAIYELLGSKDVVDFSSGWGDRLAGFCAAKHTNFYMGCDPNRNLFEGYCGQIKLYGNDKKITVINSPAEDLNFGKERFDTVFTSPPFYRAERYTRDHNQSWVRYKTTDSWLNNFLFKTLKNAWQALKPKGYLAVNLADVYCNNKVNRITDKTNDFISRLPNAEFLYGLGMRIHARPQRVGSSIINSEIIWIWKKG